jgi:biopolymer transport protein ExbD
MLSILQRPQPRLTNLSITPVLIHSLALMLLLIFITFGALWLTGETNSPRATTGGPDQVSQLVVDADQSVRLDGRLIVQAGLLAELQQLKTQSEGVGIRVTIPRGLAPPFLNDIMAVLTKAGVKYTQVVTAPSAH